MESAINEAFKDVDDVSVTRKDISSLNADVLVSPANSFGIMDGGFDKAILGVLGSDIQRYVNIAISNKYVSKEVPVGSSVEVTTHMKQYLTLLVAPTMRVPKDVSKTDNAYLHMIAVLEHVYGYRNPNTISVVMTAPCAGYGKMSPEMVAKQMRMAWQAVHRETDLHFDDIYRSDEELYYL